MSVQSARPNCGLCGQPKVLIRVRPTLGSPRECPHCDVGCMNPDGSAVCEPDCPYCAASREADGVGPKTRTGSK